MKLKYWLKWLYWKLIYQHILVNKIYSLLHTNYERSELSKLLAEWRNLRTLFDGAEYDKKRYWIN